MKYNFNKTPNRKGTGSFKWDMTDALYGQSDMLPLWVADMDFPSPKCVIDAVTARAKQGVYGYACLPDDYLPAICDWFAARHSFAIQPEWIVPTPSVVPAVNFLVQEFTHEGEGVIIMPPVYYPFANAIKNNGREMIENPLAFNGERYTPDIEDLEKKAAQPNVKMLILCSPHNPVGRVWLPEELSAIAKICARHGVLIVSDEIHCDLVFSKHKHTPMPLAASPDAQIICCYSASKTFNLPGLSSAYMVVADETLRRRIKGRQEMCGIYGVNVFGPLAQTAAYRGGADWLTQVLQYIWGNYETTRNFLQQHLPDVKPIEPEGTYLLWLNFLSTGLTADELKTKLRVNARVALDEGDMFGYGGEGFARVNLACSRKLLLEALEKIRQVFTRSL